MTNADEEKKREMDKNNETTEYEMKNEKKNNHRVLFKDISYRGRL